MALDPAAEPKPGEPPKLKRRLALRLLAVALYVAIALLVARHIGWRKVLAAVLDLEPWHVAVVVSISLLHIASRALRYHALVRSLGPDPHYRFRDGARIFMIGLSASAATPGRVGDFAKVFLLQPFGITPTQSFSVIVAERLLDLLTIVGCVLIFGASLQQASSPALRGAAWSCIVVLAVCLLALASRPGRQAISSLLLAVTGKRPALAKPRELAERLLLTFERVFPVPTRLLGFVVASVGIWLVEFLKLWVLLRLMGESLPLHVVLFVYPLSIVAGILALVPASEGVIGLTSVALLTSLTAVAPATATTALVLDRAASTLPPLLVWAALTRSRRVANTERNTT